MNILNRPLRLMASLFDHTPTCTICNQPVTELHALREHPTEYWRRANQTQNTNAHPVGLRARAAGTMRERRA